MSSEGRIDTSYIERYKDKTIQRREREREGGREREGERERERERRKRSW